MTTIMEDFDDLRIYSKAKKIKDDSELLGLAHMPVLDLGSHFAQVRGMYHQVMAPNLHSRRDLH